jgi:hypothetical protein
MGERWANDSSSIWIPCPQGGDGAFQIHSIPEDDGRNYEIEAACAVARNTEDLALAHHTLLGSSAIGKEISPYIK